MSEVEPAVSFAARLLSPIKVTQRDVKMVEEYTAVVRADEREKQVERERALVRAASSPLMKDEECDRIREEVP